MAARNILIEPRDGHCEATAVLTHFLESLLQSLYLLDAIFLGSFLSAPCSPTPGSTSSPSAESALLRVLHELRLAPPHSPKLMPADSFYKEKQFAHGLYGLKTNIHVIFRYLPESLQSFQPGFDMDLTMPAFSTISAIAFRWLQSIQELLAMEGARIMSLVLDGHQLSGLRNAVAEFLLLGNTESLFSSIKAPPEWRAVHFDPIIVGARTLFGIFS